MKPATSLISLKMAAVGLLLLTASCRQNGDPIAPAGGTDASTSLACIGKNLRLTALTLDPAQDMDGDGNREADVLSFLPECSRDNIIRFEQGGKLTGDEGKSQCPATDRDTSPARVDSGSWTYDAQTHTLHILTDGEITAVTDWDVISVSAGSIKASVSLAADQGNRIKMVMTWQAQ